MTEKYKPIVMATAKDEFKGALDHMIRNTENLIAYNAALAKIRHGSYLAHIKEGFTEAQAIELCKSIM